MKRIGIIKFTVEALHENDIFFDFIETNFKILDIDHSEFESNGIVSMLLEDISENFYFIPTCSDAKPMEYIIETSETELDYPKFIINLKH